MSYTIKGIIFHWAVTDYSDDAAEDAAKHYNFVYNDIGREFTGWPLAAQMPPLLGGAKPEYAAHTRWANSYRAGLGLLGMKGAKERPFTAGRYPFTEASLKAAVVRAATICIEHKIAVKDDTVLSHAEVEDTLGKKQRGKWDIARLPWDDTVVGATDVGDYIRDLVRAEMENQINPDKLKGLLAFFSDLVKGLRR